jgi:hypothetical protein
MLYAYLIFSMRDTYRAHLIPLDLIPLIMSSEEYNFCSWRSATNEGVNLPKCFL